MIRFLPSLEPSEARTLEPAAWLIHGASTGAWLEEMASWGVPLEGATLRVLARSAADPAPCALFVTPAPGIRWTITSPRADPYALLAGKLWIPCHARLTPPLTDAEIAALPGDPALLHPGAGLTAFVPGDALSVAGLLQPPVERATAWDRARPGPAGPPRLFAVLPEDPPRLETLLRDAGGDIGTSSPDRLPDTVPAPSLVEQALKRAGIGILGTLKWLSGLSTAPPGAQGPPGAPSWLDRIHGWSADRLAKLADDLHRSRRKEVDRLLSLLDRDPDLGLRFALPVGGEGARGIAPPTGRLGAHGVDFALSRLGGGAAADPWQLDRKTRDALVRRYRQLALRELRLGRHRRAAYIFAELLHDFRAAADALSDGRHFREAAVLLRDKLGLPRPAAECLERGGLLAEAAEIHESLANWETVGDLRARMDRPVEAAQAWMRAVEQHREKGDALAAGRLLEVRLGAAEEALALWEEAWPWSHQAGACLEARIDLLGRLGRHDAVRGLLDGLALESTRTVPSRGLIVARACAGVAQGYPNRAVRDRAADVARVIAGARLPEADAEDARDYLEAVRRTTPGDSLLARDLRRWEAGRTRPPVFPGQRPRGGRRAPIRAGSFQLPPDIMWETASARRDLLHVAGFGRGGAVLARTPWSDLVQVLIWSPGINYPHILEPGPDAGRAVLFAGSPGPRLELLTFPRSDGGLPESQAGTPAWFPDEVLGAALGEFGTVWLVREHLEHLVAWAYSSAGAISGIHPLPALEAALPEGETPRGFAPLPAVALGPALYVALALRLARIGRDGASTHLDLGSPVTALVASPAAAGPVLACAFDAGGAVIFEPESLTRVQHFGEDLADPLLTFTRNGFLVAVSEREGRIYALEGRLVVECAAFSIPGGRPVAVVPAGQAAEFAIVSGSGEVTIFSVPAT